METMRRTRRRWCAGGIALFLLTLTLAILPVHAHAAELPTTTATITVEKQLTGDVPSSDEAFSFTLAPDDAGAPMPAGAQGSTLTIKGAGTGSFKDITYAEPGTYSYTLKENAGNAGGYAYDATVYRVTVYVTTDDAGNLTAKVWANKEGSDGKAAQAVFSNGYRNPASPYAPKTGDGIGVVLWLALAACAAGTLLLFAAYDTKRRK